METKVCSKCGVEHPLYNFTKDKRCKDGHGSWCNECMRKSSLNWYNKNKVRSYENSKEWRSLNPDKVKKNEKRYRERNKEKRKIIRKEWYKLNRNKEYESHKNWINNNPDYLPKRAKQRKQYASNNKDMINEYQKNYQTIIRENLTDGYVLNYLRIKGFNKEDITPELIEVQRLLTKTKRLCKTSPNSETV